VSTSPASDPVLLITGASSGIGAVTARHAAAGGYRLILAARSIDRVQSLASELGGADRALAVRCDVREWGDQRAACSAGLAAFGRIDAAFANAGFAGEAGFQRESPEFWRDMVLTNFYGAALTIRATEEALRASRGHIVLTGSVAGHIVYPGSIYSCTKWAVTAMAEAARKDFHGSGIRVTLISPGIVDTPFWTSPEPVSLPPAEVADAVLFALTRPPSVDINDIVIRPTAQRE
jgi:NADP-dependent 3-hydroxy acid dehydrogenase YdfG